MSNPHPGLNTRFHTGVFTPAPPLLHLVGTSTALTVANSEALKRCMLRCPAAPAVPQTKASEADILAAVGDGGFSPEEFELLQELGTINIQQARHMPVHPLGFAPDAVARVAAAAGAAQAPTVVDRHACRAHCCCSQSENG